jgi:hypothetical protein
MALAPYPNNKANDAVHEVLGFNDDPNFERTYYSSNDGYKNK